MSMPTFYGREIASRLLLGTAQYPSPAVLAEAVITARMVREILAGHWRYER